MKILIVDDEAPARQRLRHLLGEHELLEAASGTAAIEIANQAQPAAALLDIRMPGMDGLELATHLNAMPDPPAIIFVTAYDQHALKAFAANAIAYLLKPVDPERLQQALLHIRNLRHGQLLAIRELQPQPRSHLSVTDTLGAQLIPVSNIRAFQATQKLVAILQPGPQLLIATSLRALEQEFSADFVRIHRNTLAAVRHIRALRDTPAGYQLRLSELNTPLPVSRRGLPGLRMRMKLVSTPPQPVP